MGFNMLTFVWAIFIIQVLFLGIQLVWGILDKGPTNHLRMLFRFIFIGWAGYILTVYYNGV